MEAVAKTPGRSKKASRAKAATPRFRSADELRDVLEGMLTSANGDERIGTLLRAVRFRVRYEFADLGVVLNLASAEDGERKLRWAFSDDVDWSPKLRLEMDSATANAWLQGKESLAIGIAHGHVRCAGDTRTTLLYLPAMRLVIEPYRRLLGERYPHLVLA